MIRMVASFARRLLMLEAKPTNEQGHDPGSLVPRIDRERSCQRFERVLLLQCPNTVQHRATRRSVYAVVQRNDCHVAVVETGGSYYLPGGGIEAGETAAAALSRECLEECGMHIQIGAYLGARNLPKLDID